MRNTLNRLDSFWLGAFGGRGQLPVSCPVNAHQSRTATPCGSDRVLHVQHDVSVKGGGGGGCSCLQTACSEEVVQKSVQRGTKWHSIPIGLFHEGPCLPDWANYYVA